MGSALNLGKERGEIQEGTLCNDGNPLLLGLTGKDMKQLKERKEQKDMKQQKRLLLGWTGKDMKRLQKQPVRVVKNHQMNLPSFGNAPMVRDFLTITSNQ